MKYGLFDTQDNLWMGNDQGPVTYDELDLARISAEVQAVQLGWSSTRIVAREFPQQFQPRLRDSIDTKRSSLEALTLLEKGFIS